jgi:hypothetical protein
MTTPTTSSWGFPSIQSPLVDDKQLITYPWSQFLNTLWNGTGSKGLSPQKVALGTSPATYKATRQGTLYISAGTVSQVNFIRGNVTVPTGILSGNIPVQQGDSITISYSALPKVNFVPW